MSSKPPPLPSHVSVAVPSGGAMTMTQPSVRAVNWSAIVASSCVSLTLVVCVLAWIITHPHRAAPPLEPVEREMGFHPLPMPLQPASLPIVEAPPPFPRHPVGQVETLAAVYKPERVETRTGSIAPIEEAPPLPSPTMTHEERVPSAVIPAPPQPVGETYGTQVLFLNNQEAAAELAKREHKLLFVMHISGNFEESCFT